MAKETQNKERRYNISRTITVQVDEPRLKTTAPTVPGLYIVAPAIKDNVTGKIYLGDPYELSKCHSSIKNFHNLSDNETTDGFVDNFRNFHNRKESVEIAYEAGQCSELCLKSGCLFSTDYRYIGGFSDNKD